MIAQRHLSRGWISACFAIAMMLFQGCAYRLGPTNGVPAQARSIEIAPFQNDTLEPRLIEAVGTALRRTMQQDGTYRLDTKGGGDIIVTGTITQFERGAVSFQPNDILTARDFELSLLAKVQAKERLTGTVLLDREVRGRTTIRVVRDLTSSERQAVPLLAQDLARNITSLLTDGVW